MGWVASNGGSDLVLRPESHPKTEEHVGDRWYTEGRVPGHEL